MQGNVWEWVEDPYHDSYRGVPPPPTDGSAWMEGDEDATRRVMRGGAWNFGPLDLRSANRNIYSPDNRTTNLGFRVGRTLTP